MRQLVQTHMISVSSIDIYASASIYWCERTRSSGS